MKLNTHRQSKQQIVTNILQGESRQQQALNNENSLIYWFT